MFEILNCLVNLCSDLLVWLSRQQQRAARLRMHTCNPAILEAHKQLQKAQQKHDALVCKMENQRDQMQYYLDSESIHLK